MLVVGCWLGGVVVDFAFGDGQAMKAAGFSMSKPYKLRMFDTLVQSKATYGDYIGASKLLAHPTQELEGAFSEEDCARFVVSKVEMLVLDLLLDQLKVPKAKRTNNAASGQVLMLNVQAFCKGAGVIRSAFAEMAGQLEIVYCVVAAECVAVSRLKKAMDELNSKKSAVANGDAQGVLMEFFWGKGERLMTAAEAIANERSAELGNDEVLESLREKWKASLSEAGEAGKNCMLSFAELNDEALNIKGKKNHEGGFNKTQAKELDTLLKDAAAAAAKNVAGYLSKRLEQALVRHEASLSVEGYADFGGIKGPLLMSAQMEHMTPAAIFDDKFAKSFSALSACEPVLKDWKKMIGVIAGAMAQVSSSMKAYKAEDSTPAFAFESVQLVEKWLNDSDLVSVCGGLWKSLFARCLSCDRERLERSSKIMQSIIMELLEGKGANLSKEACDEVLSALPPKAGLRKCLAEFLEFARAYVAVMAWPDSSKTVSLIASVQQWCEKFMAPGHEQDLKIANFEFVSAEKLQEFAGMVSTRMGSVADDNAKRVATELQKKIDKARKVVDSVHVTDVEAFKAQMKKKQTHLGNCHKQLKEAHIALKASAPEATSPDASGQVALLHKTALELDYEYVYTTCVYIVFIYDDKIEGGKLSKADKGTLGQTFETLDDVSKKMAEDTGIFREEISALRASCK